MVRLPIKNRDEEYVVQASKIIALGLNYKDHIAESKSVRVKGFDPEIPKEPIIFPKATSALIGPGEEIRIPAVLDEYDFEDCRVDHEAELAFIIKDRCKNVSPERAMDYIYGYMCLNDVSQRNIQSGDKSGWFRGKSFDTFCPVGPQIVLSEDIGDPQALELECRLNGIQVQHSNTRHMIFPIPQIVAFISKNFTLMQGDIISTGTPAGVSRLKAGDVVEIEVEGIGTLSNPVLDERNR